MTTVLLGASGYVGSAFARELTRRSLRFVPVSRRQLDYCRAAELEQLLRTVRPDRLINAAGYTGRPNVDACEQHRTACLAANAVLPGTIREVCEALRIPFGHVSSGCLYTGTAPRPSGFRETDPPNFSFRQDNCSFYSGTKALGEELLEGAEQCYLWRMRMPFHHVDEPRNLISKLLRYERLVDVRNSLSQLDECVAACLDCFEKEVEFGIFNLTNPGSLTTRQIIAEMRHAGLPVRDVAFFESETQFRQSVSAPRSHCVLDTSKAERLGIAPSPVDEALRRAVHNWTVKMS